MKKLDVVMIIMVTPIIIGVIAVIYSIFTFPTKEELIIQVKFCEDNGMLAKVLTTDGGDARAVSCYPKYQY